MSEYQYYEFQAVDRPLSNADRQVLRGLSSRARITTTSFTNSYDWGDFRGDPDELMDRWFDLHLYLANWGSRRLMMRLPARLVDRDRLGAFLGDTDYVTLRIAGENIILSVWRDDLELEDWGDDDASWLPALAPLRADLLAGDLRLSYLLWLMAVETGEIEPGEPEPMPGIGPLTGALEAFAEFFCIHRDLVQAAAERGAATAPEEALQEMAGRMVATMSDAEKTSLLMRVFNGEPHVSAELRAMVRARLEPQTAPGAARSCRSAGPRPSNPPCARARRGGTGGSATATTSGGGPEGARNPA